MATVLLQFIREVYDAYGFEGAFFDAYAAAAAEFFGEDDFVVFEAYGFHSTAHHRAEFYAELITFLGFALVIIHNGDAGHDCSRLRRQQVGYK